MFGLEPKADVDDELAFHLDMRTQELIARGVPPDRARELAERRFGDYESSQRACIVINERRRDHMRRADYFAELRQDLAYALRLLQRAPAFTIAAMLTLAIGIAATVAVFSIANAVLLKPLDFVDPDRLVVFETRTGPRLDRGASPVMFAHWRTLTDVIQDIAAMQTAAMNDTSGATPEPIEASHVSSGYFRVFGVPVARGRTFSEQEDRPGGGHVAILSDSFWSRRFARDPDVVGRVLSLNGEAYTVVGVLGASFRLDDIGQSPDVWVPLQLDPLSRSEGHSFNVCGRLRPGVTLQRARAMLQASTGAFRQAFPLSISSDSQFDLQTIGDALVGNTRPLLFVLLGAVGFVLLIACSNVASLVLLRATTRSREMAIRSAIGAGRWRIVRQLFTESLVLSIEASALGLAIGYWAMRLVLAADFSGLPRVSDATSIGVDWRVAFFTVVMAMVSGVLCGVAPARRMSRADLGLMTRSGDESFARGVSRGRMQATLVVVQIALALVLLIGSALFMRTAIALTRVDPGFDPHNVLTLRMSLNGSAFATAPRVEALIQRGSEALRGVPGVEIATAATGLPLLDGGGLPFVVVGRPLNAGQIWHGSSSWTAVSPGYFEALTIPLVRGRSFNARDSLQNPAVVIINDVTARQNWPGQDPIGQRIVLGHGIGREFQDEPEREIIGIVGNVRSNTLASAPGAEVYVPQAQLPDVANAFLTNGGPIAWIVRTRIAPDRIAASVQATLERATGLPASNVRPLDQIVSRSIARPRFSMRLMIAFGSVALLLAAMGLYGSIAYAVAQRTCEIGIRLALGADVSRVKAMVIWRGLRLTLLGLALGLFAAAAVARLLTRWLFEGQSSDPLTFAIVSVVIIAVAILATWIPARRASRIDPMIALRCD
jgi:predicted permease